MKRPKAIYARNGSNYVVYDNGVDANIVRESFYLEKKLFGIRLYKKTWKQSSNLWEERSIRKTGFK